VGGFRHLLREIIARANTSIFQVGQQPAAVRGHGDHAGSDLVWCNNQITVAHIGDSRCYRFRGDKLQQITRDHSLLQEQIDSGLLTKEAAKRSQNKNLVTRALGIEPEVEAEIRTYPAQTGDIYLLCSGRTQRQWSRTRTSR